jgi:hypothetical protein
MVKRPPLGQPEMGQPQWASAFVRFGCDESHEFAGGRGTPVGTAANRRELLAY